MVDSTRLVPSDSVNSLSSVRSSRVDLSSAPARMLTAKNRTIASAMPIAPRRLRSSSFALSAMIVASAALLEFDQDGIDQEARDDQRREQDHVAQIKHALGDRIEAGEQAEPRHRVDQKRRRPRLEKRLDHLQAAHQKQKAG